KGSQLHKLTGKVFYISMVVSVSITLVVSLSPSHESPTLFHIGVLSLYFLIGGKRSIHFKKPNHRLLVDRILAYSVVAVSLAIILYTTLVDNYISPLRIVFGVTGLGFGLLDLVLFRNSQNIKKKWLILHLSKMLGGYTAAVTAFLVAQNLLLGYFNWFVPTVFGLSYLNFWLFKLKTFKPVSI
ncbi:MAG: hypothetical protein L3J46_00985, partial [Kangiellaceae bacterium]|nr:hypothetical protein [Kangiellaceae bacterium]